MCTSLSRRADDSSAQSSVWCSGLFTLEVISFLYMVKFRYLVADVGRGELLLSLDESYLPLGPERPKPKGHT